MKAIVYRAYGSADVLSYEDVEKPAPASNEVLIKVRAASVNPYDWHFMRGTPYGVRLMTGLRRPKIPRLGADVAGEVEAVGSGVTEFKPGDAVFGVCQGAYAEFVCIASSAVASKPSGVTFEQAASVPIAALTALQGLREKGKIQAGQQVLVNGAAGGVGTFAVQIAKSFAAEVTGVCSGRNVAMVKSIGADQVIDYTQENFARQARRYDLILDCVGNHSLRELRNALKPDGRCVMAGGTSGNWMMDVIARALRAALLSRLGSRKLLGMLAKSNKNDLAFLGELIAARTVTPVIDRRYPLSKVPEAIRYVEQGHARGKVIITSDGD